MAKNKQQNQRSSQPKNLESAISAASTGVTQPTPPAHQPNPVGQAPKTHTDVIREIMVRQQQQEEQMRSQMANMPPPTPFDFSKVHIHFGIPCYGGLMYESTMTSFIQFMMAASQVGLSWSLDTMTNESLITRARNNLCAKMMYNTKATHFMFIDADIRFKAETILQMIAADKDIICGAYCRKSLPPQLNVNLKAETKIQGPLCTIDTAATGYLLFKRGVYEKLISLHPDTKYVDDIGLGKQYEPNMYAIFDCFIDEKGHYLSEDWAFSRRAQKAGYDIWMDNRATAHLGHMGTYEFKSIDALNGVNPSVKQ